MNERQLACTSYCLNVNEYFLNININYIKFPLFEEMGLFKFQCMFKQVISIDVITHDEVNNRINHYMSSLFVGKDVRKLSNVSKYHLFYLNPFNKSCLYISKMV